LRLTVENERSRGERGKNESKWYMVHWLVEGREICANGKGCPPGKEKDLKRELGVSLEKDKENHLLGYWKRKYSTQHIGATQG